jgi:hypothetical protein
MLLRSRWYHNVNSTKLLVDVAGNGGRDGGRDTRGERYGQAIQPAVGWFKWERLLFDHVIDCTTSSEQECGSDDEGENVKSHCPDYGTVALTCSPTTAIFGYQSFN